MSFYRNEYFESLEHLLQLLMSVTNLLYPNTPNVFFLYLKSCYKSWLLTKRSLRNLKCLPVPDELLMKLIPETFLTSQRLHSVDRCLFVNKKFLKCCQLSSEIGHCIPVSIHPVLQLGEIPSATLPECFVQVLGSKDVPLQEILVSEAMFHNLKRSQNSFYSNNIVLKLNANKSMNIELQFASKIVVALIQTPLEVHQDVVKDCLTNYFEKPQLLRTGDIFVINVSIYLPEACYTSGLENKKHLYFIVQELEGPQYDISNANECIGYLVDKNKTTLMQTNAKSFKPSSVVLNHFNQHHLVLSLFRETILPLCPPALNELSNSMINCFEPFLHKTEPCKPFSIKPVFWLVGHAGSGKTSLLSSVAAYFGIHLWNFNCDEVFGKVPGQIEGKLKALFAKARSVTPCMLVLSDIQLLSKNAEGQEDLRVISLLSDLLMEETDLPLIVVATSPSESSVLPSLARIFLQTFFIPNFSEADREMQLSWFARSRGVNISDECLKSVSGRCSGFLYSDLDALVGHAIRNNIKRADTPEKAGKYLSRLDFEDALDQMQSAYSDAIGAPKIPSVSWDDVGGLTSVKDEILRTVNAPLHHPELVAAGLRRSGVLLYGPPGTGKTLIAKAVATECSLNFLSVKGPELLNMYVGQSEENVREVFERARAASPCIIFFDELDSLAPNRGKSGDSGGVMDRVVSQLLAEMDGLQKSTHLFVIGATNRPDLIDPALLRPGRFDKLLYVSACEDQESIACIMRALSRKFKLSADVDIGNLTRKIPTQVTGADLYAVCSNAWRNAARRAVKAITSGSRSRDAEVEVNEEDFLVAISEMTPSVSSEDMKYFKNLQEELSANKNYVLVN